MKKSEKSGFLTGVEKIGLHSFLFGGRGGGIVRGLKIG